MRSRPPFCVLRFAFCVLQPFFASFLDASVFAQLPYPDLKPLAVDAERVKAAGLRTLVGKHIVIYTDVPASPVVDELPRVFDAAVPQWIAYFDVARIVPPTWRMNAFLIVDKERFKTAGVVPETVPEFAHGFSYGYELWMNEQSSEYYRRHLLLHEGTHGFMNTVLGSCGPPWFMEGLAELLATHRWQDGKLTLGIMPRSKAEVPQLGRVKLVQEAVAAGRAQTVADLVNEDVRGYVENEGYAWCWAFATFLDRHPKYQGRFRALQKRVRSLEFNDEFRKSFYADLPQLNREWLVFADGLEYGADPARTAVAFRPGRPPTGPTTVAVAADRGWQSSGVKLEAGKTYRLQASGRYQIANPTSTDGLPTPWPCEPGGVTIRYYRGHPLGMLLASVEPDVLPVGTPPPMLRPIPIGLSATLTPERSGTLYLRVNDSSGELDDNAGVLSVTVSP